MMRTVYRPASVFARWVSAPAALSGQVVGFSAGNNPFVRLEDGTRVEASITDAALKSTLAFRQKVTLHHAEDGTYSLLDAAPRTEKPSTLQPMTTKEAATKYKQVTRGANAVGMYAYVSRRVRAGNK